MPLQQTAGTVTVTIDGNPLPDDVKPLMTVALVDGNLNQPDLFSVSFRDPERIVLSKTGAKIGSKIVIKAFSTSSPGGDQLLSGDVTALEVEHHGAGTYTMIRGYDESHLLFRGRISQTYQNMTASDIATAVASRTGLATGQIDPTSTVYPWVAQDNVTDWQFLRRLAVDVGYEVAVVDGKFYFRQPVSSSGAPTGGDLTQTDNPFQLNVGAQILRLRAVVSSADQSSQIQVRGWDPEAKQAIIGSSPAGTKNASTATSPDALAQVFGGPTFTSIDVPYSTQAEVDRAASALADHIGGSFAELEGVARGNAKLKAGTPISLNLVGDPFDGRYVLTSVRHRVDPDEGYTTAFTVSGRNQRSLLGLTTPGGTDGVPPIHGVVTAVVTDVADPNNEGRIKVTYPWMSDSYNSDWVRVTQPGAGPGRGAVFIPEVSDEVLVAFDHGDRRLPYVVGSLYNGVDKPQLGEDLVDGTSGAIKRRGIVSKNNHSLIFFDDDSDNGLALLSGDKSMRISLNQGTTTLKISADGSITIDGKQDVTIRSDNDVSLQAQGVLSLKGASVSISADADVSVSGTPIKLN